MVLGIYEGAQNKAIQQTADTLVQMAPPYWRSEFHLIASNQQHQFVVWNVLVRNIRNSTVGVFIQRSPLRLSEELTVIYENGQMCNVRFQTKTRIQIAVGRALNIT